MDVPLLSQRILRVFLTRDFLMSPNKASEATRSLKSRSIRNIAETMGRDDRNKRGGRSSQQPSDYFIRLARERSRVSL